MDNGDTFSYNTLQDYADQAALGGVAWAGAHPRPLPKGFRPRIVECWQATDHSKRRRVVAFTKTATAFATMGTTVSVNYQGTATDYVSYQTQGERHKFEGSLAPTPA
jgi:hypothetical protein